MAPAGIEPTNLGSRSEYDNLRTTGVDAATVKVHRLEWLGHVLRRKYTKTVKSILDEILEGKRKRGRPRLRWMDDVEEDLRFMGVNRWRRKALDRQEIDICIKGSQGQTERTVVLRKKMKAGVTNCILKCLHKYLITCSPILACGHVSNAMALKLIWFESNNNIWLYIIFRTTNAHRNRWTISVQDWTTG